MLNLTFLSRAGFEGGLKFSFKRRSIIQGATSFNKVFNGYTQSSFHTYKPAKEQRHHLPGFVNELAKEKAVNSNQYNIDNMRKTAGAVIIGNEILSGKFKDENIYVLSKFCTESGLKLCNVSIVEDDYKAIADAVRHQSESFDFVFTSHYCTDPGKFVSVLMTSLSTMLQIALPHINVLSKVDLIERYDKLAFNMDFYTDVLDLNHLLHTFSEDPFLQRYKKLNSILCELVEDYGLVNFYPLNVQDQDSMLVLAKAIDKANGYIFGGLDGIDSNPFEITQAAIPNQLDALDMREKFIDRFYEQPPEDSDSE